MPLKKDFIPSLENDELIKNEDSFFELLPMINEKNDVNKQIENGETLLHLATWKGYKNVVVELLKKGAYINIIDNVSNRTAVHLAVKRSDIEMLKILLETNYDVFFYSNGLNHLNVFNIKDIDGNTPLMIAQKRGYQEIAKLLSIDNIIDQFKNQISEQLNKCQYHEEVKQVIFEKFVNDFDDCYQRLDKEINFLDKENERLQKSKSTWRNVITFGFFHKRINAKMMKNSNILWKKRKEFITKKNEIVTMSQSIKEMAALSEVKQRNEKLVAENNRLKESYEYQSQTVLTMGNQLGKYDQIIKCNNLKINVLKKILQENKKRIKELKFENNEYKKIQVEHNEKVVSKFKDFENIIRGKDQEIFFLMEENKRLEKELENNGNSNNDSGIESGEEALVFDSRKVNDNNDELVQRLVSQQGLKL